MRAKAMNRMAPTAKAATQSWQVAMLPLGRFAPVRRGPWSVPRWSRDHVIPILAAALWPALMATAPAQQYMWTTIAGAAGQSGATDGTNGSARFSYPSGVAVDVAGD